MKKVLSITLNLVSASAIADHEITVNQCATIILAMDDALQRPYNRPAELISNKKNCEIFYDIGVQVRANGYPGLNRDAFINMASQSMEEVEKEDPSLTELITPQLLQEFADIMFKAASTGFEDSAQ